MSGWRETIARCLCTPPLPLEAFNKKISASTGSSKEIAGLKKKKKRNMMTGNREIAYKRFFSWRIKGRYKHVGLMYS